MSVAEIGSRSWQYLLRVTEGYSVRFLSHAHRSGWGVFRTIGFFHGIHRQLFTPAVERNPAHEAQLLAGRIPVFRHWVKARDNPEFWRTDPLTGAEWPDISWHKIDYRPGNATGDVRILWELNRLQHLHDLAMVAEKNAAERDRAVALIEAQIGSWAASNRPGKGPNHVSAMEEALRLIALFHAFDLVRSWVSLRTRDTVASTIAYHVWHVERRLSLHSSAGNHTVAEAVALVYAGVLLHDYSRASRWKSRGLQLLRTEAARQIDTDGGGIEQATWYLLFVTDLLGLAVALLEHTGQPSEPLIEAAVDRGRRFLGALAAGPGDLPRIGDADDGYALSPLLRISWSKSPLAKVQRSFRVSGLSVVRHGPRDRLVFLHNPLGMAPGFAHGHADCLSLAFQFDGASVLIDPGTYQYGGSQEYRRYFRSAVAHNTMVVEGEDQAQQVSAFMWRRPFRSALLVSRFESDCSTLLARHEGFGHLGITHWRGLIYRRNGFLTVWDFLEGVGEREAAVHWHLGVQASVSPQGQRIQLTDANGLRLSMDIRGGVPSLVRGAVDPPLGWRSAAYAELEPCDTIRIGVGARSEPVLTVLWLAEPDAVENLLPLVAEFDSHRVALSGG